MKVAIYLRVSTEKQDAKVQRPALLQLCAGRGWTEPVVFEEVESGAKARPVLDAVCERARRGEFQVVAVWALDRLGRDVWETIARVRALWAARVQVASVKDSWTDGAEGPVRDLLLMVLSWVAEQERRRLIDRTNAGLDAAREKMKAGKLRGRRKGRDRLGRPRADQEALGRAADDVASGYSIRAAAATQGVSPATLLRFLRSRGK